jgi:Uma2 family endonuclease
MAPSVEEWNALTPPERVAVLAALPGEVTEAEMSPPEGDRHFKAKTRALGALRSYFTRQRRRIYLAAELPVYYPAEPRFAPDLLAVLDVEDADRDKWVVSTEGKGLDWVLEVHVGGDRKKDAELNVARYARLGVPEYFLYDRARNRLAAYRLASPDARPIPRSSQTTVYTSRAYWASTFRSTRTGSGSMRARRCSWKATI